MTSDNVTFCKCLLCGRMIANIWGWTEFVTSDHFHFPIPIADQGVKKDIYVRDLRFINFNHLFICLLTDFYLLTDASLSHGGAGQWGSTYQAPAYPLPPTPVTHHLSLPQQPDTLQSLHMQGETVTLKSISFYLFYIWYKNHLILYTNKIVIGYAFPATRSPPSYFIQTITISHQFLSHVERMSHVLTQESVLEPIVCWDRNTTRLGGFPLLFLNL